MGFFRNTTNEALLTYISGVDNFTTGSVVTLIIDEKKRYLNISGKVLKDQKATLSLDKISFSGMITEEVIKKRSSIGRAVAGGLLFGNTGAIVGAISGSKDKVEKQDYYIIEYKSHGKENFIQFQLCGGRKVDKFNGLIKSLTNQLPDDISDGNTIEL